MTKPSDDPRGRRRFRLLEGAKGVGRGIKGQKGYTKGRLMYGMAAAAS